MLEVKTISTGYGKKQVLYDVSLEVDKGEVVILTGGNGSGKSTLLKCIYNLLPCWTGEIFFEGENITDKPTVELLKKGLLYIPQKDNLFEDLTMKENLEMAGLILGRKLVQQRIKDTLLIFTELAPHLNRTPMKLSGGERKVLTLAMAMLHQPKMILYDEPLTGLSPQNITFIAENLHQLNQQNGTTILIVEHRVKGCSTFVSRVIGLKLGRIFSELDINADSNISELNSVFI